METENQRKGPLQTGTTCGVPGDYWGPEVGIRIREAHHVN